MAESHWKLGRRKMRGSSEGEPIVGGNQQSVTIGHVLRRHREERGWDLRQVSEMLCIRYPYLNALEEGQLDQLPGAAYALGFVKAYAECLDLDSEAVVERFKAEQRGLNSKTDLVFPSPLPEGKVPSMAVMVIAVVLAVGAYSGWIYFTDTGEHVAESVPPLPEVAKKIAAKADSDLKNLPEDRSSSGADASASPESASPETAAAESGAADSGKPSVAEKPADASTVSTVSPAPETTVENAAVEETVSSTPDTESAETAVSGENDSTNADAAGNAGEVAKPGAAASAPAVSASAAPAETEPATSAPPVPERHASASVQPPAVPAAQEPKPTELMDNPADPFADVIRQPQTYGDQHGGSRVMMRATSATWIEVRDPARNEILLTRVLYPGDQYYPPAREGLVMMTGNAGGIEISVDGKKIAPIGERGTVKRNVLLDPGVLLDTVAKPALGLQQQQSDATVRPATP